MIRLIPIALPAPGTLRPHLDPPLAARRPLRSLIVITSLNSPTRPAHRLREQKSASKNILRRSNVPSAQRSLLVLTIFDLIFAPIRTSDHSYAQSAEKLLLVNMIERGTRACIAERRSSFAVASLARAAAGDAVEDLLARTLLAGISEAKLAGSVSNHCWMKKQWSDSVYLTSR